MSDLPIKLILLTLIGLPFAGWLFREGLNRPLVDTGGSVVRIVGSATLLAVIASGWMTR